MNNEKKGTRLKDFSKNKKEVVPKGRYSTTFWDSFSFLRLVKWFYKK